MTPIWDKSEAQDVSMYDTTPYEGPLAAFGKLMVEDGRKGHSPELIGRWVNPSVSGFNYPHMQVGLHVHDLHRHLAEWMTACSCKESHLLIVPSRNTL